MSEMDKAEFWAFGWTRAFLAHDWLQAFLRYEVSGLRPWKRQIWSQHRFDLACREQAPLATGRRCSFCGRVGHDEEQEACPKRRVSAVCYAVSGSLIYPRPKGGAA